MIFYPQELPDGNGKHGEALYIGYVPDLECTARTIINGIIYINRLLPEEESGRMQEAKKC